MFASSSFQARETLTSLAAAFVTALLFISSATSLLPVA